MEWTKKERYKRIDDVSSAYMTELKKKVDEGPYRQTFHIQPKTGLLNDPNGFSYYNGQYHLFYQWFPLGPVHGVKYWYHMVSNNLVDWEDKGIALSPDTKYDSHGVFSGTGFVKDDQLHLFYTGNTRTENWKRIPYQCHAVMGKDNNIKKSQKPLIIDSPEGYTDNFRDPKIIEQNGYYYCIIGAETSNHEGAIVYYVSDDLEKWTYQQAIELKGNITSENQGFMWECPDYFELDNHGVLLFSPQGMTEKGDKYQNIYQSGYLLGNPLDFTKGVFHVTEDFTELDRGFDFYAPQTMTDPNGRQLLVGWLGLPGVDCVTDEFGWAHCLTILREISLKNGKIYQKPVPELALLRGKKNTVEIELENEVVIVNQFSARTYELQASFTNITGQYVGLSFRMGDKEVTNFYYDRVEKKLVFDRGQSGETSTAEFGTLRKCDFSEEELQIQLFMDESSVEIFVNDGLEVFTSRLYSQVDQNQIQFYAKGHAIVTATQWEIG
ncbi:MAG: sucrose-6-phosphate hydrolase [Carnobacterium sp.]|uniref:glycoside hydrolase family 32 protein n=1 Tax=Carnobacterium sp. TaxID=48221 RepID=UPI00331631EC